MKEKTKKNKSVFVPQDEQPYQIPDNWCWIKLKSVAENNGFFDGDWILKENMDDSGEVRLLQLGDIGVGKFLDKTNKHINIETYKRLNCSPLKAGDVLISRMSDPIARSCILPDLPYIAITAVDVAIVRVNRQIILNNYLNYLCNTELIKLLALKKARGTTRVRITRKHLGDIHFPLAPLAEQKRIVDRLDRMFAKLDAAKEKIQTALEKFEQKKYALLHKAFTGELTAKFRAESGTRRAEITPLSRGSKLVSRVSGGVGGSEELKKLPLVPQEQQPYPIPDNWCWTYLKNVADIVTGGTPSKKQSQYYGGDFPFFKPADLNAGRYVHTASEYLSDEGKAVSRVIPQGATAVCCIGSIGKCGFLEVEGTTNQQINSAIPKYNPLYLYYFCNTACFVNQLWEKSAATTISIVNKSKMESCKIPIAPLDEQKEIVRILDGVFAKERRAKEMAETALAKIDTLNKSLLARAFRGQLGTHNPADQPAAELLKTML